MSKYFTILLLSCCCFFSTSNLFAQADSILDVCKKQLTLPFISDGQQYQTILNGDETAEFHTVFYGGSTYRIVGCSGVSEKNLLFSIIDSEHNVLFTNKNFGNASYWDFKFMSTMNCTIEATLNKEKIKSGFAIIMIGFRQ